MLTFVAGGALFLLFANIYSRIFPPFTPPTGTGKAGLIISNTKVDTIKILTLDNNPAEVDIVAKGTIPDPCAMVGEIKQYRQGNTINFIITANKPHDVVCTNQEKSFEEVIKLDTLGFKRGTYTVNVNGISDSFTLTKDNTPTSSQSASK